MSRPTSFYYAFVVLPKPQREAMIAVWDFCRAVDDVVDEPVSQGPGSMVQGPASEGRTAGSHASGPEALRDALNQWRAELDRCYSGAPTTSQGRSLQPWIRQFNLSRQPFADLIDGVEMDLDRSRYQTFEDLREYCWRVASTVGLICIEIFGQRSDRARQYAVNLGIALQLTNILRDVGDDAERGRIYLPQDDLRRFGCTDDDLHAGPPAAKVRDLLAFEATRAREYYGKAAEMLEGLHARPLVAAEIMGRIYRETLDRIERAGYDVFSQRIRVPRGRRIAIALNTWMHTRFGRHVPA
jgi:phytoene synthase